MTESEILEILKPWKWFKLVSDESLHIMFGVCKEVKIVQADNNSPKTLYVQYLGKIGFPLDSVDYILVSDGVIINHIKYIVVGDSEEEVEDKALLMEEIYG